MGESLWITRLLDFEKTIVTQFIVFTNKIRGYEPVQYGYWYLGGNGDF